MQKKIRFYKRENKWYADIPEYIEAGGSEEECEMIMGADLWLDFLSKDKDNILLDISDKKYEDSLRKISLLEKYDPDIEGGFYITDTDHELWLCNVTKFLFGEMPKEIYYKII